MTRNWESIQQQLGVLQGEVAMMKSTQTELLTTMRHLDTMLQRVIPQVERIQISSGREGAMSPIQEEEPEQVASSGGVGAIHEQAEQHQPPLSSGSWLPPRQTGQEAHRQRHFDFKPSKISHSPKQQNHHSSLQHRHQRL